MVRVLALDLSSATGWAADAKRIIRPGRPDCGVWRLGGIKEDKLPAALDKLHKLTEAAVRVHEIEVIIYEKVLPGAAHAAPRGDGKPMARNPEWLVHGMHALSGIVERVAYLCGADVFDVAPSTWRKHFVGTGRPREKKRAVIGACLDRGWMVGDDNAADACGVWSYAKSILAPGDAAAITPLFRSPGEDPA